VHAYLKVGLCGIKQCITCVAVMLHACAFVTKEKFGITIGHNRSFFFSRTACRPTLVFILRVASVKCPKVLSTCYYTLNWFSQTFSDTLQVGYHRQLLAKSSVSSSTSVINLVILSARVECSC
jgi:hypothetical protein